MNVIIGAVYHSIFYENYQYRKVPMKNYCSSSPDPDIHLGFVCFDSLQPSQQFFSYVGMGLPRSN